MPSVQCTCGREIRYALAGGVVASCPRCGRAVCLTALSDGPGRSRGGVHLPLVPASGPSLLLGLLAVLLPAWIVMHGAAHPGEGTIYWMDLREALASPHLPVAMGLLLSLRLARPDLSVWAMTAWGSVGTWLCVRWGLPVPVAMALATLSGAALGLAQAAAVRLSRLPSWLVTAAGGAGINFLAYLVLQRVGMERLRWERLGSLGQTQWQQLLSALLYAVAMVALLRRSRRTTDDHEYPDRPAPRRAFAWVLPASGALAAGGGAVLWLTQSRYGVSLLPVGDLRVLGAVLLCGALLRGGAGTTLLAAVLLPAAMLAATAWWQTVWDVGPVTVRLPQLDVNLLVLIAMTLGVCAADAWGARGRRTCRVGAWILWAGVLLTAAEAYRPIRSGLSLRYAGLCVWSAGLALCLAGWLWARRTGAGAALEPPRR